MPVRLKRAIPVLDDGLERAGPRRLVLRAADDVEVLQVLLEDVGLGADAPRDLVRAVLLGREQDHRRHRVVPVEQEVDRLRDGHVVVDERRARSPPYV